MMNTDFSDTTTERDFEQELLNALDEAEGVAHSSTFDDCGILTRNKGLVVRLSNGAEFQLTIVQSRQHDGFTGDEDEDGDDE